MIDLWKTPGCVNNFTDTNILDWPHTNRAISSKCNRIDSKNEDQGAPEGTKTSFQKRAGSEVRGICGAGCDRSRSNRLRKNTRWRGSSSTSSRRRGAGLKRSTLWFAIKTPGAWFMDTRGRARETESIIAPFRRRPRGRIVTSLPFEALARAAWFFTTSSRIANDICQAEIEDLGPHFPFEFGASELMIWPTPVFMPWLEFRIRSQR